MGWYNTSWNYRNKITVDHTKVPNTDQSNFPVYVNLASFPASFFSGVKSDGSDIRVTTSDGVTECPIEVVAIDAAGKTGEVHFKAPSLSHTSDTNFYIYCGNSGASAYAANATYGAQNVWDANYSAVYHLQANGNDSTSNAHTLTNNGTTPFNAAQIGKGADLGTANTTKSLSIASNLGISGLNHAATISFSAKMETEISSSYQGFIQVEESSSKTLLQIYYNYNAGTRRVEFNRQKIGDTNNLVTSNQTLGTASYNRFALTFDGSTLTGLINGASVGTVATSGSGPTSLGDNAYIGEVDPSANKYASAFIDEVRFSLVDRSTDYLATENNNLSNNNTFLTIGTLESSSSALFFSQL